MSYSVDATGSDKDLEILVYVNFVLFLNNRRYSLSTINSQKHTSLHDHIIYQQALKAPRS